MAAASFASPQSESRFVGHCIAFFGRALPFVGLILRSATQSRVSKDGPERVAILLDGPSALLRMRTE